MTRRTASPRARTRTRAVAAAAATVLLAALVPLSTQTAEAKPKPDRGGHAKSCDKQNNNTYQKLLKCISADGVMEHVEAFQAIADANDDPNYPGTRAAGTAGYAGSVDYVKRTLTKAGWTVTLDPVESTYNFPVTLQQLTPVNAEYESGAFTGSGFGTVTGSVIPVDINLTPPRASSSGCEAADFAGLDFSGPADIALTQRGTCNFGDKAFFAEQAGAEAVIIFNQGNTPDREGLIVANASTLTDGTSVQHGIPVVGASFAQGEALAQPGSTAFVDVLEPETRIDYNVIAEKPGKNDDNVVMAGAHLDSVTEGPGINDNGSGSAALIELAQKMSKVRNVNTLRFAWWAAEEQGLVGSESYVANLPQEERDRIASYVNFDMIGSPNFIYGVYDADESSFPAPAGVPIPDGSAALEDLFEIFFTWQGIPYEDSEFSGRSDYQAFIFNGIPASGLFTGAEVPKTDEQEAIWEGVAGESYDPCYHQACDSLTPVADGADADVYAELGAENDLEGNVSLEALGVNSDAIAFTVLTLAYSTEDVNGVPGKRVPGSRGLDLPEPGGPEGTVGSDGGDQHDHVGPAS
ncbi:M28 family peptidase [Nocardioides euryhalodurans]|uniref:M28 family peptidase n=1 Tax=Nocardioides euryhalodurans TaxID=2518370 RepID=A0A4P7GM83_9ACTN|nr:M28 family peptidase [Nocardioides euryhalodurans]QBR93009.1 M28 family peptidase [Nocardioides euryhalodurans]